MIEIIKNSKNIKEKDITDTIVRVKAMVINSKNEVLMGHSYCEYQFLGGHVEDQEDLNQALKRELLEETGLEYDINSFKPIGVLQKCLSDYPRIGQNTKLVIYYYEIRDDRIPNICKANYTKEEKDGNFKLRYIPFDILEDVIKENVFLCGDGQGIALEILEFLDKYRRLSVYS